LSGIGRHRFARDAGLFDMDASARQYLVIKTSRPSTADKIGVIEQSKCASRFFFVERVVGVILDKSKKKSPFCRIRSVGLLMPSVR